MKLKTLIRAARYLQQSIIRGFPDSDTYSLDVTIAKFVAPRLKRLKELNNGWSDQAFKTYEDWNDALDKMIYSMEVINRDKWEGEDWEWTEDDRNRIQEGLELFGKYFLDLWW